MAEKLGDTRVVKRWFDHGRAPLCAVDSGALRGLRHRTVIDRTSGARELALWQEEHLPGFLVPLHLHDCEEIIAVTRGEIEAYLGEETFRVPANSSILIPRWLPHGFRVTSPEPVCLHAIFSSANPGIFRLDGTRSDPPWLGGSSDHLERSESAPER